MPVDDGEAINRLEPFELLFHQRLVLEKGVEHVARKAHVHSTFPVIEREIFLKAELAKAAAKGDYEEYEKIEKQLVNERKALQQELEEKKDKVRAGK